MALTFTSKATYLALVSKTRSTGLGLYLKNAGVEPVLEITVVSFVFF